MRVSQLKPLWQHTPSSHSSVPSIAALPHTAGTCEEDELEEELEEIPVADVEEDEPGMKHRHVS